jgi:hypothetical protein
MDVVQTLVNAVNFQTLMRAVHCEPVQFFGRVSTKTIACRRKTDDKNVCFNVDIMKSSLTTSVPACRFDLQ